MNKDWYITYEKTINNPNIGCILNFEYIINHPESIAEIKETLKTNEWIKKRILSKLLCDPVWRQKFLEIFPDFIEEESAKRKRTLY